MKRLTTALKWFAYGMGLGLLFAPRSGQETRQQLGQWISTRISNALNAGRQAAYQAEQTARQAGEQVGSTLHQAGDRMGDTATRVDETSRPSDTMVSGGPV